MIGQILYQKIGLVMIVLVSPLIETHTTLANEFLTTDIHPNRSRSKELTNSDMNGTNFISKNRAGDDCINFSFNRNTYHPSQ